jgi:hypothetical protein
MKTRNSALCALGLAAAITLGGAVTASAQRARSQTRIPVRKEQPAAAPEARTDTIRIVRVDTITIRAKTDTVTMVRVDTVTRMETIPLKRLAETFFGVGAGWLIPANRWNNAVKAGPDFQAQLGHYFGESPIGLRADVNYGIANARQTGCTTCPNSKLLSGSADLLLRWPLDRKSKLNPIIYALGGGGADKFTDFLPFVNGEGKTVTAGKDTYLALPGLPLTAAQAGDKSTFYHYDVGGGLEFDVGPAHVFAETKYKVINTTGGKTHTFPLVLGLNFY